MKNGIKVVVIGGGSGISVILRGIKKVTENITAVVTVADDGGSSGILREDLGIIPPGDMRNCILALSDTEPIMEQLMQYRFKENTLKHHNLGNILIAGLVEMTGSFEAALSHINDIFALKGKVFPVSLDNINIEAEFEDGSTKIGESAIPKTAIERNTRIKKIRIIPQNAKVFDEIPNTIEEADIIVVGPGSLYTSILPNLMVNGLRQSIFRSRAKVILCSNLFSQAGETGKMSIEDHLFTIEEHIGKRIFSTIFVNKKQLFDSDYAPYLKEGSVPIFLSNEGRKKLEDRGIKIVEKDFAEKKEGYIRHNADLVAIEIVNQIETKIFKP